MPDRRLPLARAREAGLLPDLPAIRDDIMGAAAHLYEELIFLNPRLPTGDVFPNWPTCPLSELNEAQRAVHTCYEIVDSVPPFEWLSLLLDGRGNLPLIVWAGRFAGIGKTGEYIEHLIRMSGGDPDALATAFVASPDTAQASTQWKKRRLGRDPIRSASIAWWSSDGPGHADFNQRVFDFALRRLPDLIALDET
jgi:hypothetical protein